MMPGGMKMMLTSMGVDVDGVNEIISKVPENIKLVQDRVGKIEETQSTIIEALARIEAKLDALEVSDELLEDYRVATVYTPDPSPKLFYPE